MPLDRYLVFADLPADFYTCNIYKQNNYNTFAESPARPPPPRAMARAARRPGIDTVLPVLPSGYSIMVKF